jgi:transcriptional regulator with XRE-family HTH domain
MAGNVSDFLSHLHARASQARAFKNASTGTLPPETSFKRLASCKDGSLRPAQMFRRCHSEQSAASATSPTDIPLRAAQANSGCFDLSDMEQTIPTRNGESQDKKFLEGMQENPTPALPLDMTGDGEPQIYLGDWLEFFGLKVTDAAKIAGCSQGYLSNIIANRRTSVNIKFLLKLSDHLGVNINDFYRRLPSRSHLNALKDLSPKAQAAILSRQQRKA